MEIKDVARLTMSAGDILVAIVDDDKSYGPVARDQYMRHVCAAIKSVFQGAGLKNICMVIPSSIQLQVLTTDQLLSVGLKKVAPLEALAEAADDGDR